MKAGGRASRAVVPQVTGDPEDDDARGGHRISVHVVLASLLVVGTFLIVHGADGPFGLPVPVTRAASCACTLHPKARA